MTLRRTTIAALIAAAVGTTALATASIAANAAGPGNGSTFQFGQGQNAGPGPGMRFQRPGMNQGMGPGMGPGQRFDEARRNFPGARPGGNGAMAGLGGPLLNLACSNRGAEALEIAFVRLSYRLDLTADQQKLFDALKTSALTAQTSYSDQCQSMKPDRSADKSARPDFLERMKDRLSLGQARLDAMNKLMPDVEAFYASLTDEQKARLEPGMPGRGQRPPVVGRMQQKPVDGPATPAAPAKPDADVPVLNG